MKIYEIITQLSEDEAKAYIKKRFMKRKGETVDKNEPKINEESEVGDELYRP